ncbi:unnamed protein product [Linum tenue]|uniref:Protein PAM68, chloroplastic n=1 Tax=Linum tenue TaxID=586396 RepID=A0AAV0IZR6_9ROSI|nr:unnamed protein product [Linum tenue]
MNALFSTQKPALHLAHLHPSKPSSIPSSPFLRPHKPTSNNPWKLNANAKGFAPINPPAKESPSGGGKKNKNNNESDEIPQEVFERMTARIFVSVGIPMGLGIGLLYLIGFVKERNLMDLPLWVPFMTTLLTFTASILGIAYGGLSTSLDPNRKGSLLGLEEAREHWEEMWQEETEEEKKE